VAWRLTCPRGQVRCIYTTSGATGQTGPFPEMTSTLTRTLKTPVGAKSERVQDLIRRRSFFFDSKPSPRCRHIDADLICGFEGSAKPGEVAGFEKTSKTPRAERFPPPRHGPGRRSRLGPRLTPVPPRLGVFNRRPPHGPSATAPPWQLTVYTRRPCTCNQRLSTQSHRTVDNSLITARSEYCSFLKHVIHILTLSLSLKKKSSLSGYSQI
jgi:hypothetical protein